MLNLPSSVVIFLWLALVLAYLYACIPATCVLALLAWRTSRRKSITRFSPPFSPQGIFYVNLLNWMAGIFFFSQTLGLQKQNGLVFVYGICLLAATLFSALARWRPPQR